ncbi:hypothetical protein LP092_15330 (plasmid) [Moraxella bovis]|uniref:Uncharacterized protein n=1 Tax=Moraxella bovis TaxID=476 RepID=A0ABY6MCT1_MORBO|nr:hypothetical protein [Moraxella bovis]UZA04740.1 hypothetical protein LP092_15330 [Moraxella bovis]
MQGGIEIPVRSGAVDPLKSKDGKESYKGVAHQYELLIGFRVQNNLPTTIIITVSPIIYMITVFYWLKSTKTTAKWHYDEYLHLGVRPVIKFENKTPYYLTTDHRGAVIVATDDKQISSGNPI